MLCFCFFFVSLFLFSRETPESQICIFPWKNGTTNKKKQQRNKLRQGALHIRVLFLFRKHSVATSFLLIFFVPFCIVFFSKERCRFGIPESPEGKKQKRNEKEAKKKHTHKAVWRPLFLFCFFNLCSSRFATRTARNQRIG